MADGVTMVEGAAFTGAKDIVATAIGMAAVVSVATDL